MTYYNPVLRLGVGPFCRALSDAGADGVLVVDLPPEESEELDAAASASGLDVIRLVAPSTPDSRLDLILAKSSGFVYAVSVAGTTGARELLPPSAKELLARTVPRSRLPVALGFGISVPEHVRLALEAGASGVVVGSKLVSIYSDCSGDGGDGIARAAAFARTMKAAAIGARSPAGEPYRHNR